MRWVYCENGYPSEDGEYLISVRTYLEDKPTDTLVVAMDFYSTRARFSPLKSGDMPCHWAKYFDDDVVAWAEKPEPACIDVIC